MSVIPFSSRREFSCEQNLKAFVLRARMDLVIYQESGGFDSITWHRRMKTGKKVTMAFAGFETGRGKKDGTPFSQPYLDFARAYVREQQSINEVAPAPMMTALKAIYHGLTVVHGNPDILKLENISIAKAKEVVEARIGAAARYNVGNHLMKLLVWLKENRICLNHTVWRSNPWKKQKDRAESTSEKDRAWQEERLLDSSEIVALADAFASATTPYEIFWSSCSVLLMFAPSRAGELHFLGKDCLFETTGIKREVNPKTGRVEEKSVTVLNLRWKAGKGGGTIPKPVHPRLEETVREAVSRLECLGKPAREAAKWAIANPDRFYRHPGCITPANHDEDAPLNYEQLCAALGMVSAAKTAGACARTSVAELVLMVPFRSKWFKTFAAGKNVITYRDLAGYAVERYSKAYPRWPRLEEVDLSVGDALCLIREHEFHDVFAPRPYSFMSPDVNLFNGALGSAKSRSERAASMFDSLGLTRDDGGSIRITTHQIRSWLSTMAERGEMDSLDLAMFAGRTRVEDNRAYDLRTAEEREDVARSVLNIPKSGGLRIIESVEINAPVTFEALGYKGRVGTAQLTGYGVCEHDWSMFPCTKAGDCMGCKDHVCIKGLPKTLDSLRVLEKGQADEFQRAYEAYVSGEYGAETWVTFQGKRLAVVRATIKLYEDDRVPSGTIIRVPRELDPTLTEVVLGNQGLKTEIAREDVSGEQMVEATQSEFLALMGR